MTDEFTISSFRCGAAVLRSAAVFCLTHGAGLYAGWSGEKLFKYLAFHWLTGGLFMLRSGEDLQGILIAWPDQADAVRQRDHAGEFHFNWRPPVDGGDALMIGDVIVEPGPDRRANFIRLVQMASAQWPDWKMRRLFTHRRGRLAELSSAAIERIAHVFTEHS